MMSMEQPRIVIVGGGVAGLGLATKLARRFRKNHDVSIWLIDENLTHVWKPSLHEFAVGTKAEVEEISFLAHSNKNKYQFRLGRFKKIDFENKSVKIEGILDIKGKQISPDRSIDFDYLVMAIGSCANDFGVEGIKEYCHTIDTPALAKAFQSELLNYCLRLETGAIRNSENILRMSIIGGGATGVELAAELREAFGQLKENGIDFLRSSKVEISVIEGGNRLLPALPEDISCKVKKHLADLDVYTILEKSVTKVTDTEIQFKDGSHHKSDITIWTAGVQAQASIRNEPKFKHGTLGRVVVQKDLRAEGLNNVFVIGDAAFFVQDEKPLAPRAQVAVQQVNYLSKALPALIQGHSVKDFSFSDQGSLVALSHSTAFGAIMGKAFGKWTIEGRLARIAYRYIHFQHIASIQGYSRALMYLFVRKASHRFRPKLKLH